MWCGVLLEVEYGVVWVLLEVRWGGVGVCGVFTMVPNIHGSEITAFSHVWCRYAATRVTSIYFKPLRSNNLG